MTKLKYFRKEVKFFDKDFIEFDITILYNGNIFSITPNVMRKSDEFSFKPADKYQQQLKDLKDKYCLSVIPDKTEKQAKALSSKKFIDFKKRSIKSQKERKELIELEGGCNYDDYEYSEFKLEKMFLKLESLFIDNKHEYGKEWVQYGLPCDLEKQVDDCILGINKNNIDNIKKRKNEVCCNDILDNTEDYSESLESQHLDSRDIQKRIDRLEILKEVGIEENYHKTELKQLLEFKEECEQSNGNDFDCGQTIVCDSYFKEFAEEEAKSCGFLNDDAGNFGCGNPLNNHIDWNSWADAMKDDYLEVEYCYKTYWVR